MSTTDVLVLSARLSIAAVLLMAAWTKVAEGPEFVRTVEQFRILPSSLAKPFGMALPWVELALALALFAGIWTQPTAAAVFGLIGVFLCASVWAIKKQLSLHCDCFGLLYRERIGTTTIVRDAVLLFLAALVAAFETERFGVVQLLRDDTDQSQVLAGLAALLVLALSSILAYKAAAGFGPSPQGPHQYGNSG